MTEFTRRKFLGGLLTATVAARLPLGEVPVLYLDGVHDDFAGLDALIHGQPFVVQGECIEASAGVLHGARLLLSRTIVFDETCRDVQLENCTIECTKDHLGPALRFRDRPKNTPTSEVWIQGAVIEMEFVGDDR